MDLDLSDGSSDGDEDQFSQFRFTSLENISTSVNILKPQIDKIFSEVQKNLPTIDFYSSDVSSDNDEPIFFHQNLKVSELNSLFDDDKDLDTSLSQGDNHQSSPRQEENQGTLLSQGDGPQISQVQVKHSSSADKNHKAEVSTSVALSSDLAEYDNDLAALLSQSTYPTDEEIESWRSLAKSMEESELELEMCEEIDYQRSRTLGHFSFPPKASVSLNSGTNRNQDIDYKAESKVHPFNMGMDHEAEISFISEDEKKYKSALSKQVVKLKEHLEKKLQHADARRRKLKEEVKKKDKEIVSKFTPQEPTMLSMRMLEELDLDTILNAANEENIPVTSLRLVGTPAPSQMPKDVNEVDNVKKRTNDPTEELTMIQKLAQLSMRQSGCDLTAVTSIDPHTGAAINSDKERLIDASEETASQPPGTHMRKDTAALIHISDSSSQTSDIKLASSGTNTATRVDRAKILYGRLKNEKRDTEPPTIFIDLRGFEKHKEEEKQGLMKVQRVLGLSQDTQDTDSSSDEEMVERCNWRQTRQKLKEDLSTHGAAATLTNTDREKQKTGVFPKLEYKKPPRVINLQEHKVSKNWNQSKSLQSVQEKQETEKQEEGDNKLRMEKLEMEKEKQRLLEEARKLREQKQKEHERRMRMSQHISAARSLATTLGRQTAGENTAVLFDMEVSYEPPPTTLPSILSPEQETLLLTVHLSSNGEIIQHRNRSNRSVDTGEGLSATYTALLSWLLSLVPHDFTFLSPSLADITPKDDGQSFYVIGLQQMWFEEELKLHVVVTPSKNFNSGHRLTRSKKGKDENKGCSKFFKFMNNLLLTNTVATVCPWLDMLSPVAVQSDQPEEGEAPPYTYSPPLPKISTKPLSTFVQINPDSQAAKKIFNIPVGFCWQTVDNDETWCDMECHDDSINYETQNTMSLIYKKIFQDPLAMMSILNRASQEGLDLAGLRLLYPSAEQMKLQGSELASSDLDNLNQIGPVLAMALRGTFARTIWLDSVGPSDPELARRTDPNSLCALYGGDSKEKTLLFCPRNLSRVQSELSRWFGGHISKDTVTLDVGIPYLKREENKGKKGRKHNSVEKSVGPMSTQRPPASLTATCKGDIILILSPLVPISYTGVLMSTAQRRGFQMRGVKRICMSVKMAGSLGIVSARQSYFCPGACDDDLSDKRPQRAIAPCTVLILRKENASHNAPSLIEAFMVQLTLAGLLGCVQTRVDEPLTSQHLFHTIAYSDTSLTVLGGNFSKCPDYDPNYQLPGSTINQKVDKALEQTAVVVLLGHDLLKRSGLEVAKFLNVLPYTRRTPVQPVLSDRTELLAMKWMPALSTYQAKELTPYEVGDIRWRQSLNVLTSEPALILVLRGVSIIQNLRTILEQQESQQISKKVQKEKNLHWLMSNNSCESEVFTRLFFYQHDLYPDPLARSLLPYLPQFKLYFNITGTNVSSEKRVFSLKPHQELNLVQENILEDMTLGQQLITTVLLIKPGAVQKYSHRIFKKVVQERFEIIGFRLLVLNESLAEIFVARIFSKDNTEKLKSVEALTCGPSAVLALRHQNAVKRLIDLVGPEEPTTARCQNQFLWRGEFGRDIHHNGIYCSKLYVDAVRDIKLLFPDGLCCEDHFLLASEGISAPAQDSLIEVSSTLTREVVMTHNKPYVDGPPGQVTVEDVHSLLMQTICLVFNPYLMKMTSRSKDVLGIDLISHIMANGFQMVGARLVWMTQKQAECFLAIRGCGQLELIGHLCSGPCLIVAMERDNAVLAFDSILTQSSEGIRIMKEYGHHLIRASSIKQSNDMLAFFFDQLMPGSHLSIREIKPQTAESTTASEMTPNP
ncbi:dynein axonemal assembly factor 8-like isoform X2 [Biomphalaria glabrata]|nr:dynein axonemal assembly factor 8-like isoform X2 [Biomphalaria glabrata]XP_055867339.1 dynein axonemal assembly factor 8-like isoform X2 [Biomphalaria glabrata]